MNPRNSTNSYAQIISKPRMSMLSERSWAMVILGVFCLINFLVCTHTPIVNPDEVQYVDPAANWYFGEGFTSPLWGQDWHELCLTYVPFYHALLMAAFKLAGFGLFQARALAILLAAGGSFLIWQAVCNLAIIQKPGYRLLCLLLTLSGSASSLAFRHMRPDATMFFLVAALFFACSLAHRRQLQIVMVFLTSLPLAAGGVALVPYVGILALLYLWIYRAENLRLLLWLAAGTVGGLVLLAGFLAGESGLEKYLSFLVLPQTVAGTGINQRFWHDKIFGTYAGDSNLFNIFFGNPLEFFSGKTLFDYSAFLLFLLAVLLACMIWNRADSPTRKLTIFILATALTVPLLLHLASHFHYYYRWMTYMPLAILAPRLLEASEQQAPVPTRRLGFLLAGLAFAMGIPGRTLAVLPSWNGRSAAPVAQAVKSVARPDDIAVCDFKVYFAARPYVKRIFAYHVTAYGDFQFIKNLPTNNISLLVLSPDEIEDVIGRIGGNWRKLPPEAVAGIQQLNNNRYQVDFYRRAPEQK